MQDSWALKVILDTLAYTSGLPLCVEDARPLDAIAAEWSDQYAAFKKRFPRPEKFGHYLHGLPEDPARGFRHVYRDADLWHEVFARQRSFIFPVVPCNALPLARVLRDHRVWRWWEYLFLLKVLNLRPGRPGSGKLIEIPCRGFLSGNTLSMCGMVAALNLHVLSFPNILSSGQLATVGDYPTHADEIIQGFLSALSDLELTPRFRENRIRRMLNLRPGVTRADLNQRLLTVIKALEGLTTLEIDDHYVLTNSNLRRLALNAYFIALGITRPAIMSAVPKRAPLRFYFPLLGTGGDAKQPIERRTVAIEIGEDRRLRAEIVDDYDWSGIDQERTRPLDLDLPPDCTDPKVKQDLISTLGPEYSRVVSQHQARRDVYDFESFLILRDWMNEEYGLVSTMLQLRNGATLEHRADPLRSEIDVDRAEELVQQLTRRIGRNLVADLAVIYRYDYIHERLVPLSLFYRDPRRAHKIRQQLEDRLADMDDTMLRDRSVAYRCIASNNDQVVFARGGRAEDECDELGDFDSLDLDLDVRSANLSPIRVFGRPWGAIGVFGHRPYQFAANVPLALDDLANVLGSHCYQQWLLLKLGRMTSIGVSARQTDAEKFDAFCREICELCMTEACVLWLRDPEDPDRFVMRTAFGRPDLDDLERMGERPSFFIDDEGSVLGKLIARGDFWIRGRVGAPPFADNWLEKDHTRSLQEQDFRSACVFTVASDQRVIAAVSLYSKNDRVYDEYWRKYFEFFADQISVVLQTTMTRGEVERQTLAPIRHEYLQLTRIFGEKSEHLASKLSQIQGGEPVDSAELQRLLRLTSDIQRGWRNLELGLLGLANEVGRHVSTDTGKDMILRRAVAGARQGSNVEIALSDLIFTRGKSLEREHRTKGIRFSTPGGKIRVRLNADNLDRIIGNLMDNAGKYALPHSLIRIQAREGDRQLRLTISNDGMPLAASEEDQIFDRGFRGRSARSSKLNGEGLGLFYVGAIAKMHDIEVNYRQQPGISPDQVKHEFTIIFPRSTLVS